jgi:uncharacterized protein (DUF885 family)
MTFRKTLMALPLLTCIFACASPLHAEPAPPAAATPAIAAPALSADQQLDALADRMVAEAVAYDPTSAYFIGVPAPDNRRWADRSLEGIAAYRARNDALLADLKRIDAGQLSQPKRFVHASMVERLEAEKQRRVCHYELWDANHMSGWHMEFADVAREQPVGTAEQRAEALERWSSLPTLVDQEIANARTGLNAGYSAPKAAVRRLIKQIETIASAAPESLPYWQVAERSDQAAFRTAFREVIAARIQPAFGRYLAFLNTEYLPEAREAIAITANPDGRACYAASLRGYTTLKRSPEDVFELGKSTVNANLVDVKALGLKKFGTDDLPTILRRINAAPDNRFKSEEELIAFSRSVVDRAREKSAALFERMPAQEMRVEPFHAYRRGTGGSSYYERQIDPARPAFYRIASEKWRDDTRGGAEITAVHEGYPGHHMQISFATMTSSGPIANMLGNSAYAEGWARYSEALAEEAGIYQTDYALMTRRLWPARGMVVDPGIHLMGWPRERAIAFVRESGRFQGADADDLVDRIAVWPGQLTAYDSGALEIVALRRQAEKALGACFSLPEFHARVLETGIVPLGTLRDHIGLWIAAKQCPAAGSGERGR